MFRLHRSNSRNVLKLVIKRALDVTIFKGLDSLLNINLMKEAGICIYDLLA